MISNINVPVLTLGDHGGWYGWDDLDGGQPTSDGGHILHGWPDQPVLSTGCNGYIYFVKTLALSVPTVQCAAGINVHE